MRIFGRFAMLFYYEEDIIHNTVPDIVLFRGGYAACGRDAP